MDITQERIELILKTKEDEADKLLNQRPGIHNMYGALGSVRSCRELINTKKYDLNLLVEFAEIVLCKMRVAVQTGVYPDRFSELGLKLEEISRKLFGR